MRPCSASAVREAVLADSLEGAVPIEEIVPDWPARAEPPGAYRVRFEAYALVQLHGLPSQAFDALLDRVEPGRGALGRAADATRRRSAYRRTMFGSGPAC